MLHQRQPGTNRSVAVSDMFCERRCLTISSWFLRTPRPPPNICLPFFTRHSRTGPICAKSGEARVKPIQFRKRTELEPIVSLSILSTAHVLSTAGIEGSGLPIPGRSTSCVGRCSFPSQATNIIAPFNMNRSRCADISTRKRNRPDTHRPSKNWKPSPRF
jgi:hypothetical protein